ncbi:DUF1924 domain-containing protein [Rhodocista pekingensis]|uniref:DUF1924 domain-containing protein n=1 Tax=Rhodocista pekingensis TaxID=201185 RepID=A0ABW2KRB1_9PROT
MTTDAFPSAASVRSRRLRPLVAAALLLAAGPALAAGDDAASRDALLASYAVQAKAQDPAFTGFSAERGRAIYLGQVAGAEADGCAACHTADPRATGQHRKTGRAIKPVAVSVSPWRFTDADYVEKHFRRDCPGVLGRECSAQEKGDYISFLASQ